MSKVRTLTLLTLLCVSLAFAGCCGCDFNPCDWNPCDPCGKADDGGGKGDGGATEDSGASDEGSGGA